MLNYRQCAGIILFNRSKQVLLCARNDKKSNCWQFPQGGINEGESPAAAALRELNEETSVTSAKVVYSLPEGLCYNFPDAVRRKLLSRGIVSNGQNMYWNLLYFYGDDSEINLNTAEPEFKSWRWANIDEAVTEIVAFKRGVYKKAVQKLKPIMENYQPE